MIRLVVNESTHEWPESARELPLLYALRNDLGLRGPRFLDAIGHFQALSLGEGD